MCCGSPRAVVVAGLFTPPLEGGLRALWPGVLSARTGCTPRTRWTRWRRRSCSRSGPLLVTLCVAAGRSEAALLVINAVGVLGALSVVVSEPSRAVALGPREAHWLGALRSAGLLALLGAFFFVGLALGSIAVAAVAYADEHGGELVSGCCCPRWAGALVGGLVYGARQWPGRPERRLRLLVALLAVGYLPLTLVPGPVGMTVLAGLAGVFLAPALACAFVVVDRHAPTGTVTEAFSWLVTTFGVGAAVGTAVVGPAVERGGAAAGFAVAGAGGASRRCSCCLATGAISRGSRAGATADAGRRRKMIETGPSNPVSEQAIRRNVQSWTAAFSGWRTSTASHARSGDSADCRLTKWRGTSSAVSCHGAAAATSSCGTAPASTSTWARTRNTRLPSATT